MDQSVLAPQKPLVAQPMRSEGFLFGEIFHLVPRALEWRLRKQTAGSLTKLGELLWSNELDWVEQIEQTVDTANKFSL